MSLFYNRLEGIILISLVMHGIHNSNFAFVNVEGVNASLITEITLLLLVGGGAVIILIRSKKKMLHVQNNRLSW